ncbi:type II secretion system F family protein [Rhodocyclus tenuis]|uniref:General secretion pathway protein F n=1 Tax=Rhodocyclus tenuis TaxID=1066 RepID=A0A840GBC5_RHOTE|nr:type II secretion system F family protein [Rhodocyclus tenuis]MBB4249146.1 general secretion pathway protein F [Rhodocyclus tenuis]
MQSQPSRPPSPPSPGLPAADPARSGVQLRYRDAMGVAHSLTLSDVTERDALRRAAEQGWAVLSISALIESGQEASLRGERFPLLLFSQQLLALLESGLTLTEAITTLLAKEKSPSTRSVQQRITERLAQGENFSDVLARLPDAFPPVYIATVRASERTGDLPQALGRYIAYQQQFDEIRKKLISAAIYPAMLLVVGGFVTLFLLGYVVPRFSAVYESAGRTVPWLSSLLLGVGSTIRNHWLIAAAALLSAVGGIAVVAFSPTLRRGLLERFLRLPWLAGRVSEFRLGRFYRALSLLLASGIPLAQAMGMVSGLLGPREQRALQDARRDVEEGHTLSHAFVAHGLATPVAEQLIRVGERSGQLSAMLERTARFHDDDFSRWVDWASRLLEPVLMVAIGGIIGTVVVLLYVPIFELAGSLQ